MPRKQKTVYEKIEIVKNQINDYKAKIEELDKQLIKLNKEKDELEMHQLFEYARENNLSLDEVINALKQVSLKKQYGKNKPED